MNKTTDGIIVTGATTSMVWMQYLDFLGQGILMVGGLVLLGFRIVIAYYEYKEKKRLVK